MSAIPPPDAHHTDISSRTPFIHQYRSLQQLIERAIRLDIYPSSPFRATKPNYWEKFPENMSARRQVESLLAIIKDAAYSALDQYEKTGAPTPVLDSTEGHLLDHSDDNIVLKKIINKLEGACEQLCTTLAPPSHTIMNVCPHVLRNEG